MMIKNPLEHNFLKKRQCKLVIYIAFLFFCNLPISQAKQKIEIVGDTIVIHKQKGGLHKISVMNYHPALENHVVIHHKQSNGKYLSSTTYLVKSKKVSFKTLGELWKKEKVVRNDSSYAYIKGKKYKTAYFQEGILKSLTYYEKNGNPSRYYEVKGTEAKNPLIGYRDEEIGIDNLLEGQYKEWNENDRIVVEGAFKNNKKDGLFVLYAKDGSVSRQGVYKKGKLLSGEPVVNEARTYDYADKMPVLKMDSKAGIIEHIPAHINEVEIFVFVSRNGNILDANLVRNGNFKGAGVLLNYLKSTCKLAPASLEGVDIDFKGYLTLRRAGNAPSTKWYMRDTDAYQMEHFAVYPGGEGQFRAFIQQNMKCPQKASKEKRRAYVAYKVDVHGFLKDVHITRSSGNHYIDAEAVRVVNLIPRYKPRKIRGRYVVTKYVIPLNWNYSTNFKKGMSVWKDKSSI